MYEAVDMIYTSLCKVPVTKGSAQKVHHFLKLCNLQCCGICGEFTPRADRSLASIQRMHHNLWESSIDKTAHWFTRRSCACCPFGKERCKDCGVCSSWLRFEKRIHLEPRRLSNSLSLIPRNPGPRLSDLSREMLVGFGETARFSALHGIVDRPWKFEILERGSETRRLACLLRVNWYPSFKCFFVLCILWSAI